MNNSTNTDEIGKVINNLLTNYRIWVDLGGENPFTETHKAIEDLLIKARIDTVEKLLRLDDLAGIPRFQGMYWLRGPKHTGSYHSIALGGSLADERQAQSEIIGNIYENPELLENGDKNRE